MSKARPHQFPTASRASERPKWMRGDPVEVKPLALNTHGTTAKGKTQAKPAEPQKTRPSIKPSVPPANNLISIAPQAPSAPETAAHRQELEAKAAAFAQAAVDLAALRASVLANAESQVLDLATAIATVILERELERDPELYRVLAHTGIQALGATGPVVLRVSKDSYAAIVKVFGGETAQVDGVEVHITLDLAIEGLGVIAESGDSRVDMSLVGRLRAVRRALEDERRRATEAA